jgi:hypothetical protein
MRLAIGLTLVLATSLGALGCGGSDPDNPFTEFVIAVDDETFVLRVSDPETIRLGFANLRGEASVFPIGPLVRGDGGFNAPWSWHIDPAAVRFTEIAIEVCDGRPSYVEEHVDDFVPIGYCPWGGRVVGVRP